MDSIGKNCKSNKSARHLVLDSQREKEAILLQFAPP